MTLPVQAAHRGKQTKKEKVSSPADAEAKEEHDKGVQISEGGCVVGWQTLQEKAGQRQREKHADLSCQDTA